MRSFFLSILVLALVASVPTLADPVRSTRSLEWRTAAGETLASGTETYETGPTAARYRLDLTLDGGSTLEVTHTYDPWEDRHTTHLKDEASSWWVEYSTSTELSFATTAEGLAQGPLRMVQDNPRVTVELRTSDGWQSEVSGPARMPGPAAEKRLHAGQPHEPPRIPLSAARGLLLLERAVVAAEASKIALIQPLLDAVEPWLSEERSNAPTLGEVLLIEAPVVRN